MDNIIGFEMTFIVVDAIRGRRASFMILTARVSEIFGGQRNSSILVYIFMHGRPLGSYDTTLRQKHIYEKSQFMSATHFVTTCRTIQRQGFQLRQTGLAVTEEAALRVVRASLHKRQ